MRKIFRHVKVFWRKNKRPTLWAAPVIWQIFFSGMYIWFGAGSYVGATFREPDLLWITNPPYDSLILFGGLIGFIFTFFKSHLFHIAFGIGNVFLLSLIFLTYLTGVGIQSQATGLYGLLLIGAIWLCIRLSIDKNVIVTWLD